MRPQNLLEHTQRRKISLSSPVAWGLMGIAALLMLLQAPLMAEAGTNETGGLEFNVLEASTSSGSRSKEAARPEIKFEVIDVATGSGMGLKGQDEIVPAVTPAPMAMPERITEEEPVFMVQNQATVQFETEGQDNSERTAIFAALDTWHRQTMGTYNYDIGSLQDPFLPIKEVRGTPDGEGDPDDPKKPILLRMRLNQLKLVAITTLSDRPGGSLASFEDGAGASYILRQGDLIGRDNGRITLIEPSQVTVEERPRGAKEPQATVIKLNVLNNTAGLTRESDQQPPQIEIQSE